MWTILSGRTWLLHVFELWIGFAGIVSGVVFFYDPAAIDRNALSQVIGKVLSATWSVSYMLAGFVIWYGLLKPSPKWEAAALWVLGTATAVNGIAIIDVFGLRGTATAATLIALTAAAWVRAILVQQAALSLSGDVTDGHHDDPG